MEAGEEQPASYTVALPIWKDVVRHEGHIGLGGVALVREAHYPVVTIGHEEDRGGSSERAVIMML